MRKVYLLLPLVLLLLTACGGAGNADQTADTPLQVTVYYSPTWGCCGDWIEYLVDNGYEVREEERATLDEIKVEYQIPAELQSCHTAIVDGYVVEGHVPVREIERMLSERPDIIGIAVPGMPPGSPGMEVEDFDSEPFDVVTFTAAGEMELYASYP